MSTYPANRIQEYLDKLGRQLLEQCIEAAVERDSELTPKEIAASRVLEPGQKCWYFNPGHRDTSPRRVEVIKHARKKVLVRSPESVAAVQSRNQISLKYLHPTHPLNYVY